MRLEDKEGRCVIKVVGREAILRAREEERQVGEACWAGALLVWCGVYTCGRGEVSVCLSVCVQRLEEKERQKEEQRRKLEEAKVGGVGG